MDTLSDADLAEGCLFGCINVNGEDDLADLVAQEELLECLRLGRHDALTIEHLADLLRAVIDEGNDTAVGFLVEFDGVLGGKADIACSVDHDIVLLGQPLNRLHIYFFHQQAERRHEDRNQEGVDQQRIDRGGRVHIQSAG